MRRLATLPSTPFSSNRCCARSRRDARRPAFGVTYGRPEPAIEAVAGAPAIKTATLTLTVDYESDTPLS